MTINIKEQVTAGNCVVIKARAGNLWYKTALGFEFPVPFADMGEATFEAETKGLTLMRYIRKHAEAIEAGRGEVA